MTQDEIIEPSATSQAQPTPSQSEPIYQFYNTVNGQWLDISKDAYSINSLSKKRIVYLAPPKDSTSIDKYSEATAIEASNRAINDHNEITKLKSALEEITKLKSSTMNFGVARAIACEALGIKHTDSKGIKPCI